MKKFLNKRKTETRATAIDSSRLLIRSASDQDIGELVSLLSDDTTGGPPNDPQHDVPATFRCPAARIFVAERDGEMVGTLTASWNGRNGEFRYFWIARPLRRTKWMRAVFDGLYNAATRYLRAVGMRRILFFVRPGAEGQRQIRLYRRELAAEVVEPTVMVVALKTNLK